MIKSYKTRKKNMKPYKLVKDKYKIGQPTFIGTTSIEKSNYISKI
jgi:preprotein translocase subunit SecA